MKAKRVQILLSLASSLFFTLAFGTSSALALTKEEARAAYEDVYRAYSVSPGWSGSVSGCRVGSESQKSIDATLRAVNSFRKMAGVQPVSFSASRNRDALAGALMLRAEGRLSYDVTPSWKCYSAAGERGIKNSSIFGSYGGTSGAIAVYRYMGSDGASDLLGRSYILNPGASVMGTGNTGSTSALMVRGTNENWPSVPLQKFVAWPPPGHVPSDWFSRGWSLEIGNQNAEVSGQPSVAVKINGKPVSTSAISKGSGMMAASYGWTVPSLSWLTLEKGATIDVSFTGIRIRRRGTSNWQAVSLSYRTNSFYSPEPGIAWADINRKEICVTSDNPLPISVTGTRAPSNTVSFRKSISPGKTGRNCVRHSERPGYWKVCWEQPGNDRWLSESGCSQNAVRARPQLRLQKTKEGGKNALEIEASGAVVGQMVSVRRIIQKRSSRFWRQVGSAKVWKQRLAAKNTFPTTFAGTPKNLRALYRVETQRFENENTPYEAYKKSITIP